MVADSTQKEAAKVGGGSKTPNLVKHSTKYASAHDLSRLPRTPNIVRAHKQVAPSHLPKPGPQKPIAGLRSPKVQKPHHNHLRGNNFTHRFEPATPKMKLKNANNSIMSSVNMGLRTPQTHRSGKHPQSSIGMAGTSKASRQYIPYRPSHAVKSGNSGSRSVLDYDTKSIGTGGRSYKSNQNPTTPQTERSRRSQQYGSHGNLHMQNGLRTPIGARHRERERQKAEQQRRRDKFFNADDAYKRLNRRDTLQDKKRFKSLTNIFSKSVGSKLNLIANEECKDGRDGHENGNRRQSNFDSRSMHSITTTNMHNMQHISISAGNLNPNIVSQFHSGNETSKSSKTSKTSKFVSRLPKCCQKLVKLKRCFNVFHKKGPLHNQAFMDNKSVLTRHLDEIDTLSDIDNTLYPRVG